MADLPDNDCEQLSESDFTVAPALSGGNYPRQWRGIASPDGLIYKF